MIGVESGALNIGETISEERAQDESDTIGRVPDTVVGCQIQSPKELDQNTYQFRRGCSRRVHHIDTIINILGEMDASKAPRMNRKTSNPAPEVKAVQIMQLMPHPKKQITIHQLTGNLTNAYTETSRISAVYHATGRGTDSRGWKTS